MQARLADGAGISIYPSHAPLLGETVAAPIRYADREGEHTLELEAGFLQVALDRVTIFSGLNARGPNGQHLHQDATRFDRLARDLLAEPKTQP